MNRLPRGPEHAWTAVDEYVEAYERALDHEAGPSIRDYLPAQNDPLYLNVLSELVRIDLERSWSRGTRKPLDGYRQDFPEVFLERQWAGEIAYEGTCLAGRL